MTRLPDWRERAACRGMADRGDAWWWPPTDPNGDKTESPLAAKVRVGKALEVCARCTVKGHCWDALAASGELSRRKGWVAGGQIVGGRYRKAA